jgi:hypothetical protein
VTMFSERSLFSDLLGTWMTKEWLGGARANRFFLACSLVNILFLITVVFVFWGSRPWRLDLFQYSQVRIILGLLGGLTAITGIMLMHGTRKYWEELDDSSRTRKKLWFWILHVGVNFGSCAYYFFVYRPRVTYLTQKHRNV